jgi:hypothetical protein
VFEVVDDDSVVLRDASGKEMHVDGVAYMYVDLYEGKYYRNARSTRTRIGVIVSSSLNDDEELLLSKGDIEKLRLIPSNWPFAGDFSQCRRSTLSQAEAEQIIQNIQTGGMDRCMKVETSEEVPKSGPFEGYETREDWLSDHLWSSTGSVEDVPGFNKFPEEIKKILTHLPLIP